MARYKDAILWLVENDDTEFLTDPNGCISVTAALVADLFGKTDLTVCQDLIRTKARVLSQKKESLKCGV